MDFSVFQSSRNARPGQLVLLSVADIMPHHSCIIQQQQQQLQQNNNIFYGTALNNSDVTPISVVCTVPILENLKEIFRPISQDLKEIYEFLQVFYFLYIVQNSDSK